MSRPDWLLDIEREVPVEELARCMSHLNRFGGASPKPYNVAKHSVVVMHLLPLNASFEARKLALMHDAHEPYTGDVLLPIKQLLGPALKEITDKIDLVLWDRYKLEPTFEDCDQVDRADKLASKLEVELLGMKFTARIESALNLYADECHALANASRKSAIATHMSHCASPDTDANLWLFWWNEIRCNKARARLAT